jgi:hypothetical protein
VNLWRRFGGTFSRNKKTVGKKGKKFETYVSVFFMIDSGKYVNWIEVCPSFSLGE